MAMNKVQFQRGLSMMEFFGHSQDNEERLPRIGTTYQDDGVWLTFFPDCEEHQKAVLTVCPAAYQNNSKPPHDLFYATKM